MSGRVRCFATQSRQAGMATPMCAAVESNIGIAFGRDSHRSCVVKSESCIGQNLSWTEAHIAASAAGIAF